MSQASPPETFPQEPPGLESRSRVEGFASQYRLSMPERQRSSLVGEVAGRRTGSSIEFQDRKDYTPGDDLRSVDWRAYARTDRLSVKLYREEICPAVEIVVDTSLSMSTSPGKRQRAHELTYLFWLLAQKHHALTRVRDLSRQLATVRHPLDLAKLVETAQEDPLPSLRRMQAGRQGGIVVLVSDLLFPFDPKQLVSVFSRADRLIVLQVLSSFEAAPPAGASVRLQDAESHQYLDVKLDRATVEGYQRRLEALRSEMLQRVQLSGGVYVWVRDADDLETVMRQLLDARAIEV